MSDRLTNILHEGCRGELREIGTLAEAQSRIFESETGKNVTNFSAKQPGSNRAVRMYIAVEYTNLTAAWWKWRWDS